MLPDEHIKKFQKLYKEHCGEEISYQEAYEKGMRLVRFVEIVYRSLDEKNKSTASDVDG